MGHREQEGVLALWRGWLPSVIGVIPYVGLNFAVYETSKDAILSHYGAHAALRSQPCDKRICWVKVYSSILVTRASFGHCAQWIPSFVLASPIEQSYQSWPQTEKTRRRVRSVSTPRRRQCLRSLC